MLDGLGSKYDPLVTGVMTTPNSIFLEWFVCLSFEFRDAIEAPWLSVSNRGQQRQQSRCEKGLYQISTSSSPRALISVRSFEELWRKRLGHPSSSVVQNILQTNKFVVSSPNNSNISVRDACQQEKSHQLSFSLSTRISLKPLELVHSDVWGPTTPSVNGYKYYCSFIDDYSKFN